MFSDKKERQNTSEPGTAQNRINEGTKLKGDISSTGFFRIDGSVEGNIKTPSKVVLGKAGNIIGTLTCENADFEGRFEGKLNVSGTLHLRGTAHIEGEVVVGKLAVEPGATFNASCLMKGANKEMPARETPQENGSIKPQNHIFDRTQRAKQPIAEQSKL